VRRPAAPACSRAGWHRVGEDLLRVEQAVDADAVCCRLVPDAGAAAVSRRPQRRSEPVGAGAAQVDRQLKFQGVDGDHFQVTVGPGDHSRVTLAVERPPQGFFVGQCQAPPDAVLADPAGAVSTERPVARGTVG